MENLHFLVVFQECLGIQSVWNVEGVSQVGDSVRGLLGCLGTWGWPSVPPSPSPCNGNGWNCKGSPGQTKRSTGKGGRWGKMGLLDVPDQPVAAVARILRHPVPRGGFQLPSNAGMYGKGVYFAECPTKSSHYSKGSDLMLLCDVQLGMPVPPSLALKWCSSNGVRHFRCNSQRIMLQIVPRVSQAASGRCGVVPCGAPPVTLCSKAVGCFVVMESRG